MAVAWDDFCVIRPFCDRFVDQRRQRVQYVSQCFAAAFVKFLATRTFKQIPLDLRFESSRLRFVSEQAFGQRFNNPGDGHCNSPESQCRPL